MPNKRPILIQCPHLQRLIPGTYEAGADGEYLLAADGTFILDRARCGHNGGRCMETLCALHRHNRGGPRTWFPQHVQATGPSSRRRRPSRRPMSAEERAAEGKLDLLC